VSDTGPMGLLFIKDMIVEISTNEVTLNIIFVVCILSGLLAS